MPETTLLGQPPGSIFTHRNIANLLKADDESLQSVLEYAIVHLKVQHVVLCGHTKCGGVAASLGGEIPGAEFLNGWLKPLRELKEQCAAELGKCGTEQERQDYLVEKSVSEGVKFLRQHHRVQAAAKERGLKVHGAVYDVGSGELKEIET